ncbi:unnamed protein product [Amoebophrya sp. A25]|nr:unnamed protein product [Amoebophrya sp. A25]|eukprot:GSA25T00026737001.1
MACQRRDVDYSSPASFAMYPMQLKKIENGGIYGRCFDKGFVAMISLHPVLELYCKTGFPAYRATHEQTHRNYKYGGWITCDTLMVPSDAVKLFSLEEAISRGRYNPVTSTEWVGCSCPAQEYMWAYKASRRVVDDTELLSIEIKCAPGF